VFTKWKTCAVFCLRFGDQLAHDVLSQVQMLEKVEFGKQNPSGCVSVSSV
jgi:hypothetical protein